MKFRTRHRWIAWLLPFFVLRALVPAGFMWALLGSGVPIVLCSGVSSSVLPSIGAPPAAHDAHAEHRAHAQHQASGHESHGAGHQHDDGHDDSSHETLLCAFAVAGFAFVDGLQHASPESPEPRELARPDFEESFLDHGPLGVVRIRGPPPLRA